MNMFVIENYMHIEHRHKTYGLPEAAQHRLEQHMEIYIYISMTERQKLTYVNCVAFKSHLDNVQPLCAREDQDL